MEECEIGKDLRNIKEMSIVHVCLQLEREGALRESTMSAKAEEVASLQDRLRAAQMEINQYILDLQVSSSCPYYVGSTESSLQAVTEEDTQGDGRESCINMSASVPDWEKALVWCGGNKLEELILSCLVMLRASDCCCKSQHGL
jgi:hypothetical protein